jgi:hypothetical protein
VLLLCAAEVKNCHALEALTLEGNRITTLHHLELRPLKKLRSLQLHGNPLDHLPEISHCTALRSLSLANTRILADAAYTRSAHCTALTPHHTRDTMP